MVMQPTSDFLVDDAATTRTADLKSYSQLCYHSTGICSGGVTPPHCLEPSDQKLLTPPTPSQKNDIQF